MVEVALGVARDGDAFSDGVRRLRTLVHATPIPAIVHPYDQAALSRVTGTLAEQAEIAPVDATVVRDGARFDVTPSTDGRSLSAAAVGAALAAPLATADPADVRIRLEPVVIEPDVTSAEAWRASLVAERTAIGLRLKIPAAAETGELESLALTPETIAAWLSFEATEDGGYGVDHRRGRRA